MQASARGVNPVPLACASARRRRGKLNPIHAALPTWSIARRESPEGPGHRGKSLKAKLLNCERRDAAQLNHSPCMPCRAWDLGFEASCDALRTYWPDVANTLLPAGMRKKIRLQAY